MKTPISRCLWAAAIFCGGLWASAQARAQAAQNSDDSPFLPSPSAGGAAAAEANEPLELHGIMPTSDGLRFCIYDAAKKTSKWVGLNEAGDAYVVKSADPARDTVTVSDEGRLMTLSLRKAKVESSFAVNGIGPGAGLPPGVSSILNPTAADEQRRLQAIAAEVRRRRLAREAADRAAGGGGGMPQQNR